MKQQIIVSESDWDDSMYKTLEWEHSVIVTRWEHDYIKKEYVIDFKTKEQ